MINVISLRLLFEGQTNSRPEPIITGLPFRKGEVLDTDRLQLIDDSGEPVPAYFCIAARWPDESIKWANLYFLAVTGSTHREQLYVRVLGQNEVNVTPGVQHPGITIEESEGELVVSTGKAVFDISKEDLGPFNQVFIDGDKQLDGYGSHVRMKDYGGNTLKTKITSIHLGDELNTIQRTLTLSGGFYDTTNKLFAEFVLSPTFYAGLTTVKIDFRVINPKAAGHYKGTWDLGSKGSISFSDLTLDVCLFTVNKDMSASVRYEEGEYWRSVSAKNYCIYQDSSGGDNWRSYNHVNAQNNIPVVFQGYKCYENEVELDSGLRADPMINLSSDSVNLNAYISGFWQNFPKAIELKQNQVRLKLFPDQFSDNFELQGGEQKTHTLFLDFCSDKETLNWCKSPIKVQIDTNYFSETKAIHLLPKLYSEDNLQILINRGVAGNYNFFEKREIIDEYGWRNYGDMYADHEELEYKGELPLVSHYNNQYDMLDGLLRQYLVSGDTRWFELARPLAQHVIDIDIYNTTEDRDEYNGGLFWHTDHYSHAYTSTHRTYTFRNSVSYDGAVGGGPGTEHCYTAGLTSFYFLTGDPVYKDAVLGLVRWIERAFEGSGTLVERLHKFLTRDVSIIRKLMSGRSVPRHRYPFTRATGNYMSALLDGYLLSDDANYINKTEAVMRKSIHPNDDIALRQLGDVESNWSYLICLQAICRYMAIKSANGEIDNSFYYARDCVLHYSKWIMANERPFLESSEVLDFPNDTWVAQDLRKAYILRIAACLDTQNTDSFRSAAETYIEYVTCRLNRSETIHYTRILVILMQNYPPEDSLIEASFDSCMKSRLEKGYPQMPIYTIRAILSCFMVDIFKCLRRFSVSKEFRWLKFRIKTF